ncbi:hypothetical protein IKF88_00805 [Candidatus Saccharibacteria bacterium]|nr:hypothetical protein [Candidatus Saccharibacteria bacterium]
MEQNADAGTSMTPVVENKQKSGNGLKIATVIACVVAICGIGFGVYGMVQNSQKDSEIAKLKGENSTQNTVDQDDNTDTNVDGNAISVTEAEKILAKYIGEGNSTMAYGLNTSYNTFTSDFNGQQEAFLTYSSISDNEKETVSCVEERYEKGDCTGKSISYDLMSEKYQSLFGDYSSIEKKNYAFQNFFYLVYDDSINAYREFILPGGGYSPVIAAHKVASVKKAGEKMVVSLIFAELNTDVEVAAGICGPTSLGGGLGVTEDTLNEMVDSMSIYEFTLSPYNGSYVLTGVEKIN